MEMKYRNNPGNLRYAVRNRWIGQVDPSNGFCQFEHIHAGLRALCITLDSYRVHHNLLSVQELISRYAPSSENDTDGYVRFVCSYVGCSASETPFSTPSLFVAFVSAICRMETGYALTEADKAVVLARYNRSMSFRPLCPKQLKNELDEDTLKKLQAIQATLE